MASQELIDELTKTLNDIKSKSENSVTKTEVDSMINELKHALVGANDKKHTAEDFIQHMTECDDKNCSIHMMSKEFEKRGFLKAMALSKKLNEVQKVGAN